MATEERHQSSAAAYDEQSPLLGDAPRLVDSEQQVQPDPRTDEKPRYRYAWRIFWGVVAVFVLAVFVKAWVDAKDTNVSIHGLRG